MSPCADTLETFGDSCIWVATLGVGGICVDLRTKIRILAFKGGGEDGWPSKHSSETVSVCGAEDSHFVGGDPWPVERQGTLEGGLEGGDCWGSEGCTAEHIIGNKVNGGGDEKG